MKFPITLLFGILLPFGIIQAQIQDTIKYLWPYSPNTSQPNIGGTFGEYRSTSVSGHYHTGTDMSGPAGKPVYAVLPGIVASAFDDGGTGYDSYVRVISNVNGVSKNITYYHTRPIVSNGQQIAFGQQVSTVAIDHVHLIDYLGNSSLTGNQLNALRPDGGITIYNDPWKPHIRTVKFHLDGTATQLPASSLGSKVDIIVRVEEVNGSSSASLNNGTYKIGYKILSSDSQTVVYAPPDDGLKFIYYDTPSDNYVNLNFYQPEASTSDHVYILTNGTGASSVQASQVVVNNYWNVDDFPYGNYVVMIFTEDVRGNADTVYVPVTTTDIDLIPPAIPQLKSLVRSDEDTLKLNWIAPTDSDLKGYRLFYSIEGSLYNIRDNESALTNNLSLISYYYPQDNPLYLRLHSVDSAATTNISEQSDVYGIRMLDDNSRILIVDGFDRLGGSGSWQKKYHDFVIKFSESFNFSYESCSNDEVINGNINLNNYDIVMWILADESSADETFSSAEQSEVAQFLEAGGKLFVSGSEIAWDLEGSDLASSQDIQFLRNYLKAKFTSDDSNIYGVYGIDSTLFSNLAFGYGVTSQGSPYAEDYPDVIDTTGGSLPILAYNGILTAGIAYTGRFNNSSLDGQIIYLGFPFETVYPKQARIDLMNAILKYFGYIPTDIENDPENLPLAFNLEQNYPNPFNPATKISYSINKAGLVKLIIYDLLGREVKVLVNDQKNPGKYSVDFNASDLASGIYIYRLQSGPQILSNKMILLK